MLAGLLLGVVNAIVRPFALLLSLPALLLTLGLFLLVINAAMLGLVALMLPGFHIAGFWTAVGGAIIVSIVSWIGSWFIGSRGRVEIIRHNDSTMGRPLQPQPAVDGSFCWSSSRRFTSFCGQLTSATPANMTAMPMSWFAPNCSSRNHQPSTAAIAGFT